MEEPLVNQNQAAWAGVVRDPDLEQWFSMGTLVFAGKPLTEPENIFDCHNPRGRLGLWSGHN